VTSVPTQSSSGRDLREQVQSLRLPSDQPPGPSRWLVWGLCVLLTISNVITGYMWWAAEDARAPVDEANVGLESAVEAFADQRAAAPTPADVIALESKGYLRPVHQILVSPKVSGMVVSLDIEEGMRVSQGDVLAVIEQTEYQAENDRAEANLELMQQRLLELENGSRPEEIEQARATLAEAKETLVDLNRDYERLKALNAQNASSEQALTQAESLHLAQQQRVAALAFALELAEEGPRVERIAAARAEVRQAEADLTRAAWRLSNCTIRAPIDGTILVKNAEEGNIVNPVAFNGSFSLCEMADLSDLEVELDIQERDIHRVFEGQRCRVRAEAFPDRAYDGVVSRLMPIADRAKGAVPVRVQVEVPEEEEGVYLKPEMGALVTFYKRESDAADDEIEP